MTRSFRLAIGLFLGFTAPWVLAQQGVEDVASDSMPGNRYLEDQFYTGIAFNILLNRPEDAVQRSLSYNLQAGFIKDIPLNERRNFGLGIGVGYAANSYYSNIRAEEGTTEITYSILRNTPFKRSKFETHAIEFPLELRWRTSTAQEYKFWRVYAGVKLAYVFAGSSKYLDDFTVERFSNPDIAPFQMGLQLNFGFNTFNVHSYYGLTPLLRDDSRLDSGETIPIRTLRLGVIFYIL